jgi:hypothetical protein
MFHLGIAHNKSLKSGTARWVIHIDDSKLKYYPKLQM